MFMSKIKTNIMALRCKFQYLKCVAILHKTTDTHRLKPMKTKNDVIPSPKIRIDVKIVQGISKAYVVYNYLSRFKKYWGFMLQKIG